jgi:hypothetical protein
MRAHQKKIQIPNFARFQKKNPKELSSIFKKRSLPLKNVFKKPGCLEKASFLKQKHEKRTNSGPA